MDFVKHTSAKRQQHSSDSFRMTSQIEREWEKTLRTTFGVTGTAFGDEDDDEVGSHKQQNHQQQQQQPAMAQQKAREVLGVIDERRSSGSGSTRVDGASMDGGSGLMVPGGVALGLRERRGSLEGPGRSL